MMRHHSLLLAAGLSLTLAACGSARRSEPIVGPLPLVSPQIAQGQIVFHRNCHQCHAQGEAALGPALNNFPAPGFLIKFQVRNGLGAMPAFPESKISPAELDALVAYMMAMRRHG
jgi:mono/diheme cytochrome c family protein